MALDTQAPPFGATAAGALALVPEARLIPGAGPAPVGKFGVTEAQLEAWVAELTGTVAMRLDGWQRVSTEAVAPETTSDRDQLATYARAVIHNGAASYLEAARHPERAGVADTSYAAVLWARYRDGLTDLIGWLEARLADPAGGDTPEPETDASAGVLYNFPAPLVGDGLRF